MHLNCATAASKVCGNGPAAHSKDEIGVIISKTISRMCTLFSFLAREKQVFQTQLT